MRNLVLLRGISASGKSTWLKENKLEQYTVSADNLRLLYAGVEYNAIGQQCISQKSDVKVWRELFNIVETRMKYGLLTIVDATHTSEKAIKAYDSLCEQYNYRMTIIEFDIDVEEAIKRNSERDEYKKVPEDVIRNMAKKLNDPLSSKHQKCIIKSNSLGGNSPTLFQYLSNDFYDLGKYDKIIVFGDIHASYSPLKEYFDNAPYSEKNFYIFIGDYLDRNYQANEVVEFIFDMMQKDNVILLQGNHENHIKKIIRGESFKETTDEFVKTWSLLSEENREKLKTIGKKVRQVFCFMYTNKNDIKDSFICTHGGIPVPYINTEIPTSQIICGVGRYSDMQGCDENFAKLSKNETIKNHTTIYSIHGHRNLENVDIQNTDRTFNLCDDIEHGGYLRILEITKDGFNPIKIKNNDYIKKSDQLYTNDIVKKLHECGYVKEKLLDDGIVSFNFTREAFRKNNFNDISVLARGLFVDSESGKIIARSYNKFFNAWFKENETNSEKEYGDCSIYSLENKLKFPVFVYKKENGYLGIVSWNYKIDDFFVASKSTNQGDYAQHFKEMFEEYLKKLSDDQKEKLIEIVKSGKSMIFEVIDEIFDPHIIRNEKPQKFVLLDIVNNDFSETYMGYDDLLILGQNLLLNVKTKVKEIQNFKELIGWLETYNVYNLDDITFSNDFAIEGFVMKDSNDFRFKFKTAYYCFWKSLRNKLEVIKLGNKVKNWSKDELKVMDVCGDKQFDNVLELREAYFKGKN